MADVTFPKVKESNLPEASMVNVTHLRVVSTDNSQRLPIGGLTIQDDKVAVSATEIEATTLDQALDELALEIASKADTSQVEALDAAVVRKTTQVIAGAGLTGGGTLADSRTINVVATDDSIIVGAEGIKVDTQNVLDSTSTTKPLSAAQGKKLQDEKEPTANKKTVINDSDTEFPTSSTVKLYTDQIGVNVLSKTSRFDTNTVIADSAIGGFDFSSGTGTVELADDGVLITPTNVTSHNVYSDSTTCIGFSGKQVKYKFWAKKPSDVSNANLHVSFGNTVPTGNSVLITLSDDWAYYEKEIKFGSVYTDRIGFHRLSSDGYGAYYIKNLSIQMLDGTVLGDVQDISDELGNQDTGLTAIRSIADSAGVFIKQNLLSIASRIDGNTVITPLKAGIWEAWRTGTVLSAIDGGMHIDVTGGAKNAGLRAPTIFAACNRDDIFYIEFYAKRTTESTTIIAIYVDGTTGQLTSVLTDSWVKYYGFVYRETTYSDGRITIGTTTSDATPFDIKNIVIKKRERLETILGERASGKYVSVIGDSISTCSTFNAIEFTVLASDIGGTFDAYPTYYDIGKTIGDITIASSDVGILTTFTPVIGDIGKTIGLVENYNSLNKSHLWWQIMCKELGLTMLQNVSWSGASITSHEGTKSTYKTSYAWHPAQVRKCKKRDSSGATINPDYIIVYRGTNDFSHAPYTKLTTFGASNTAIPSTDVVGSDYGFKEGLALTVARLREAYPLATIVLCTLNVFKRIIYDAFPTRNGTNTLPEFNNAIREVADAMGCGLIEFDKCGITFENIYPTYASDSATTPTHPNSTGHAKMAEKAIRDMIRYI